MTVTCTAVSWLQFTQSSLQCTPQILLLEIILLYYKEFVVPAESLLELAKLFQVQSFFSDVLECKVNNPTPLCQNYCFLPKHTVFPIGFTKNIMQICADSRGSIHSCCLILRALVHMRSASYSPLIFLAAC